MAVDKLKAAPTNETSWTTVYGEYCKVRIVNNIVFVKGYSNGGISIGGSTSSYTSLTTLPAKYRPSVDWFAPVGWAGSALGMRIKTDGTVEFTGNAASYWNYSTCYPLG